MFDYILYGNSVSELFSWYNTKINESYFTSYIAFYKATYQLILSVVVYFQNPCNAYGDLVEIRTPVMRMKISCPYQLDDKTVSGSRIELES